MPTYTIGIDFGTLSGRALLVDTATGAEVATATLEYPHGVMDTHLAETGEALPPNFALQHPADYLAVLEHVIPTVLREAGVAPSQVAGLGIDFTCCTLLSLDKTGTPLCLLPAFRKTLLAYALLWKHHAAKPYADRFTQIARERGEKFLDRCGGMVDDEWALAKMLQVLEEAPEVFAATDRFMEAGDWVTHVLTGTSARSYHFAAYKFHYQKEGGYPSPEYLAAVDGRLRTLVEDKLQGELLQLGSCAGHVTKEAAARFGLAEGTPVAIAVPDGHVAGCAAGLSQSGDMFAVLGTSGCFMVIDEQDARVPGICGTVADGILPGFFGYEAGLCCVGDHFAFAAERLCSPEIAREAESRGVSVLQLLSERAARKKPGESGVLALNWFNGNRSILVDSDLSGLFVGMTLATAPEDLLRALMEATGFGARNIIENFEANGVQIKRIIATGGIARKNPFLMQLYADILGREIAVTRTAQAPALGAAIGAAVAGGVFPDVLSAVRRMRAPVDRIYTPNGSSFEVYSALYREYKTLHDYFGRHGNDVMHRLRALAAKQRGI